MIKKSNDPRVEDVLTNTSMTVEEKIALLERWAYDVREMAVAEEEGMMGGGNRMSLQEIERALARLREKAHVDEASVFSKHGGRS